MQFLSFRVNNIESNAANILGDVANSEQALLGRGPANNRLSHSRADQLVDDCLITYKRSSLFIFYTHEFLLLVSIEYLFIRSACYFAMNKKQTNKHPHFDTFAQI